MEMLPGISGMDETLSEESAREEFSWKGDEEGECRRDVGTSARCVCEKHRGGRALPSIIPCAAKTGKQSSVGIGKGSPRQSWPGDAQRSSDCRLGELQGSPPLSSLRSTGN